MQMLIYFSKGSRLYRTRSIMHRRFQANFIYIYLCAVQQDEHTRTARTRFDCIIISRCFTYLYTRPQVRRP